MSGFFSSLFYFVVTLGILITFHEFGHYWVARKLGVKVLRFSVGFGRPLWTRTAGADGTEYVLAAIPMGGYVKMLDEREGPVAEHELERAFNRQTLGRRAAIVAAGPVFNFILALFIYWIIFMFGVAGVKPIVGEVVPQSAAAQGGFQPGDEIIAIGDEPTATWQSVIMTLLDAALVQNEIRIEVRDSSEAQAQRTLDISQVTAQLNQVDNPLEQLGLKPYRVAVAALVGRIEPGSAAERGGLRPGDRVVKVDDVEIKDWGQWVEYVRSHPERDLRVTIERDGSEQVITLRPAAITEGAVTVGRIGATVKEQPELFERLTVVQRFGPIAAIGEAVAKTWDVTVLTLRMLVAMIFGDVSVSNLSGPISIAQYAGGSASIGLVPFLTFLAVVSISLGVLNLLPIPILDGGHLLFYGVEWVQGRPVSVETEMAGQRVGVVMIVTLMIFAFYNDLVRVFGS